MSTVSASALGAIALAVALCVTPVDAPDLGGYDEVYDNNGYEDPDIDWAEAIGPETRSRVAAAVDHYLADPDDQSIPSCWEDEALVVTVDYVTPDGPYAVGELVGYLGCVPVDNLPVTGNRPSG